jgi:hypothetical protein
MTNLTYVSFSVIFSPILYRTRIVAQTLGCRRLRDQALPPVGDRYMPLYFFHLRDGVDELIDEEGRELDDPRSLAVVTLREARSILSAEAQEGRIALDQRIDVEDHEGRLVHRLQFADAVVFTPPDRADKA